MNEMKKKYVVPKAYAVFVSTGSILAGSGESPDTEQTPNDKNTTDEQFGKGNSWDNGLWDEELTD